MTFRELFYSLRWEQQQAVRRGLHALPWVALAIVGLCGVAWLAIGVVK